MDTNVKILIAIHNIDGPKAEFSSSLANYWGRQKYPSNITYINDTYIPIARNTAVAIATDMKATHLMFIDSDMSFPAQGIDALVERDKDIIGGLYFGRKTPLPVALDVDPELGTMRFLPKVPRWDEPFKVPVVGTGFMLIKMDVFNKIPRPHFLQGDITEFGVKQAPYPKDQVGEDVFFCLKANKYGIDVWCDPTIPLGHVGRKIYTKRDYELYTTADEKTKEIYGNFLW